MPAPCPDVVPHFVTDCLNLAQFVPSFTKSRNRMLQIGKTVWQFLGPTVAGLHQTSGQKKTALIVSNRAAQDVVVIG
jgi:hypothetical protein